MNHSTSNGYPASTGQVEFARTRSRWFETMLRPNEFATRDEMVTVYRIIEILEAMETSLSVSRSNQQPQRAGDDKC